LSSTLVTLERLIEKREKMEKCGGCGGCGGCFKLFYKFILLKRASLRFPKKVFLSSTSSTSSALGFSLFSL
jgi:hypothetical protein